MLFSGTIAENIRYGKLDATADDVIQAAKRANAHDFISGLPQGYETELGEGGPQLSGGERQRVCVARAFIKDSPILILDEPTSSIDSKTEAVILDALDDLMVGRTSIMIAHRLSTDSRCRRDPRYESRRARRAGHARRARSRRAVSTASSTRLRPKIKSRSATEGGAQYEEQLIDTITQEVGDRLHAQADGHGEVESPALEPPAPRSPRVPRRPRPPLREAPRSPRPPAARSAGSPGAGSTTSRPASGSGRGQRRVVRHAGAPTAPLHGTAVRTGPPIGHRPTVKKIRDGLHNERGRGHLRLLPAHTPEGREGRAVHRPVRGPPPAHQPLRLDARRQPRRHVLAPARAGSRPQPEARLRGVLGYGGAERMGSASRH